MPSLHFAIHPRKPIHEIRELTRPIITQKQMLLQRNVINCIKTQQKKNAYDLMIGTQSTYINTKNGYIYSDLHTGRPISIYEYKRRYYQYIHRILH